MDHHLIDRFQTDHHLSYLQMDHLGSTVIISITVINKHPIMAIITIVEAIIY